MGTETHANVTTTTPEAAAVEAAAVEELKKAWHDRCSALQERCTEHALLRRLTQQSDLLYQRIPKELAVVRAAGYAFSADLEPALAVLQRSLAESAGPLRVRVTAAAVALGARLDELRRQFRELDVLSLGGHLGDPAPVIGRLDEDLSRVERAIEAQEQDVVSILGDQSTRAGEIVARIEEVRGTLRTADAACFQLEPGEHLYLAVVAVWLGPARVRGVLHITDRRALMEERDTEGGILGIGARWVQAITWAVDWGQVAAVRGTEEGLFGNRDLVHFDLHPGAIPGTDELVVEVTGGVDAMPLVERIRPALDGGLSRRQVVAS
jgi:hypothetical protein